MAKFTKRAHYAQIGQKSQTEVLKENQPPHGFGFMRSFMGMGLMKS